MATRRGQRGAAVAGRQEGLRAGDWVLTPQGPGRVQGLWADSVVVEMDFAYRVRFALEAVSVLEAMAEEPLPCALCGAPTLYRCRDCGNAACPPHISHGRGGARRAGAES
jgi:hypothetical protein